MTPLHPQESFHEISSYKPEMDISETFPTLSELDGSDLPRFHLKCNQLSNEEIKEIENFDEVFRIEYQ